MRQRKRRKEEEGKKEKEGGRKEKKKEGRKKRKGGLYKKGRGGCHLNTAEGEGRRPDVGAAGKKNMYGVKFKEP